MTEKLHDDGLGNKGLSLHTFAKLLCKKSLKLSNTSNLVHSISYADALGLP